MYIVFVLTKEKLMLHAAAGSRNRHRGYYMPARGYEFYLRVVNCAHS